MLSQVLSYWAAACGGGSSLLPACRVLLLAAHPWVQDMSGCVCGKQQASTLASCRAGLGARQASGAVYQQGLSAVSTRVPSAPNERAGNCLDMRWALRAHASRGQVERHCWVWWWLVALAGVCVTIAQTAHGAAEHRSNSASQVQCELCCAVSRSRCMMCWLTHLPQSGAPYQQSGVTTLGGPI